MHKGTKSKTFTDGNRSRLLSLLKQTRAIGRCVCIFSVLFVFATLVSCRPTHELAYIADATRDSSTIIENTYAATIHPGDQLYIYISSQTPESVIPFNQETHAFVAEATKVVNGAESAVGQQTILDQKAQRVVSHDVAGYLVDENGYIIFPVLGKVLASGLTPDSLGVVLQHELIVQGFVSDPVVTVQLMNFRVAIIGEVKVPREIHLNGTRLTLFEALAMCGDLTIYGQRTDIKILRENNGEYTLAQVDLTSKDLFDSPYYYLQQNDIVYVTPNEKRKKQSEYDAAYKQDLSSYVRLGTSAIRVAAATYYRILFSQNEK